MVNGIQKFTKDDIHLDLIKKELDNKNNPYTKAILCLLDKEYNVKDPNQIFGMDEQQLKNIWADILNRLTFINASDDIPNHDFFSGSNHKSVFTSIETGLYHQIEDLRAQLI